MKQGYTTWLPPVSISLLLHLAVIALYLHQPQRPAPVRQDTLLVEMQSISTQATAPPPPSKSQPVTQPNVAPVIQPEPEPLLNTEETPLSPVPVAAPVVTESVTTTPASTAPDIQPLSKLTRPPSFLRKIDPVYPASEQRSGSQAYVLAEITLDAEGKLLGVKILRSAGKQFDDAVIEAIRHSEFQPGYIDSKPVAVRVQVPFRFKLK